MSPSLPHWECPLFLLICCGPWGVRRSKALRHGLCGAFRAKRRRTPQGVMTLAIDSVSAASFSARSLAARDDLVLAYCLPAWRARGAPHPALPPLLEVVRPDLRSPCVLRESAPRPLHPPTDRSRSWFASVHNPLFCGLSCKKCPRYCTTQSLLIQRSVSNRKTFLSVARLGARR